MIYVFILNSLKLYNQIELYNNEIHSHKVTFLLVLCVLLDIAFSIKSSFSKKISTLVKI